MLKGDLVQRIQDSNRFELMRFAVFKEIEEYLEENRNGFVTKEVKIVALSSWYYILQTCRMKPKQLFPESEKSFMGNME